ncbi:hypothetical protein Ddye_006180 [Dipteronia dyeriana]|uniref:FAF domain-containing protein n=1 Tax=Dipteronia dyeriana TaxID=168575 RepID=A0AAD9XHV4_9ROSI|nr:hypothetical protein Ddye_006180 [Dipteronia dyeriana]
METPKKPEEKTNCTTNTNLESGLKALTICSDNDHKHCNSCIMTSNLMSPPSSPSFSHIGDYMGMESCVDLMKNDEFMNLTTTTMDSDDDDEASKQRQQRWAMEKEKKKKKKERDIPPPISLLARTGNLSSHMPFVLKRYYTGDGRLILREERVKHHEYFKAHRSNGHLTLQLVPLDHDDDDSGEEEEVVLQSGDDDDDDCGDKNDNGDENECVGIGGNSSNNKCLDYSSVRMSSSCFLGVPVPAIKPIHG